MRRSVSSPTFGRCCASSGTARRLLPTFGSMRSPLTMRPPRSAIRCRSPSLIQNTRSVRSDGSCWVRARQDVVQLKGRITTALKYGPPGFGEDPKSDRKVEIFILLLARPANVCGDSTNKDHLNTTSYRDVKEIQLILPRPV